MLILSDKKIDTLQAPRQKIRRVLAEVGGGMAARGA